MGQDCVHVHAGVRGGQKRALELQVVVSQLALASARNLTWVLSKDSICC